MNSEFNEMDQLNQTKYINKTMGQSSEGSGYKKMMRQDVNASNKIQSQTTAKPSQNVEKKSAPVEPEPKIEPDIPFWTQNPNAILDKDHMLEFFPTGDMTLNQKLNAITRLLLALTVVGLFITKNQIQLVFIGFISILGVIAMFHYYKRDEGFAVGAEVPTLPDPALDYLAQNNLLKSNIPIFQAPDSTNPYGNVLVSDYELNPEKLPAAPITNPIVADMVTQNAIKMVQEANPGQPDIANKLFRDLNEQLNFEQMNRQFVSNPATTIPNDQGAFAEFCYGSMVSCKEGNLFACARNTSHYTNY